MNTKNQKEKISESRCRDAVMLYITRIVDRKNGFHSLKDGELAYLNRLVYSETFLLALKFIRIELKIEDIQFFNMEMLRGIDQLPGEDEESLGYKLVEWVHDQLEEYRKEY